MELDGVVFEIRPHGKSGKKLLVQCTHYAIEAPMSGPEDLDALSGYLASEAAAWRGGGRPHGPDPYRILGVHPQAPLEVITLLYKARAMKGHPDTGGDAAAWRAIQVAYDEIKTQRGVK